MTALDTMKSALQCSKTEAAKLRIRVRQLEEKLVEVAAIGEQEADKLRQGSEFLVAENARLVAANTRLKGEVARLSRHATDCGYDYAELQARWQALTQANTPLRERVAALEKLLSWVQGCAVRAAHGLALALNGGGIDGADLHETALGVSSGLMEVDAAITQGAPPVDAPRGAK